MAIFLVKGPVAEVVLEPSDTDDVIIGRCIRTHACFWREEYDSMNDAAEYAADHADHGPCPTTQNRSAS